MPHLGQGFKRLTKECTQPVVQPTIEITRVADAGVSASISFHLVSNEYSLSKAFTAALNLGAAAPSMPALSFEIDASYLRRKGLKDDSKYLTCIIVIQKEKHEIKDWRLDETVGQDIERRDNIQDVLNLYGDSFVSEQMYGSTCCLFLEEIDHSEELSSILQTTGQIKVQDDKLKAVIGQIEALREAAKILNTEVLGVGLPPDLESEIFSIPSGVARIEAIKSLVSRLRGATTQVPLTYSTQSLKYAKTSPSIKNVLLRLDKGVSITLAINNKLNHQQLIIADYIAFITQYDEKFGWHENDARIQTLRSYREMLSHIHFQISAAREKIEAKEQSCFIEDDIQFFSALLAGLPSEFQAVSGITFDEKLHVLIEKLRSLLVHPTHTWQPVVIDPERPSSGGRCSNMFPLQLMRGRFNFDLCLPDLHDKVIAEKIREFRFHLYIKRRIRLPGQEKGYRLFENILAHHNTWYPYRSNESEKTAYFVFDQGFSRLTQRYAFVINVYYAPPSVLMRYVVPVTSSLSDTEDAELIIVKDRLAVLEEMLQADNPPEEVNAEYQKLHKKFEILQQKFEVQAALDEAEKGSQQHHKKREAGAAAESDRDDTKRIKNLEKPILQFSFFSNPQPQSIQPLGKEHEDPEDKDIISSAEIAAILAQYPAQEVEEEVAKLSSSLMPS